MDGTERNRLTKNGFRFFSKNEKVKELQNFGENHLILLNGVLFLRSTKNFHESKRLGIWHGREMHCFA